eukprot:2244410-Amphidinium_carterae.1
MHVWPMPCCVLRLVLVGKPAAVSVLDRLVVMQGGTIAFNGSIAEARQVMYNAQLRFATKRLRVDGGYVARTRMANTVINEALGGEYDLNLAWELRASKSSAHAESRLVWSSFVIDLDELLWDKDLISTTSEHWMHSVHAGLNVLRVTVCAFLKGIHGPACWHRVQGREMHATYARVLPPTHLMSLLHPQSFHASPSFDLVSYTKVFLDGRVGSTTCCSTEVIWT